MQKWGRPLAYDTCLRQPGGLLPHLIPTPIFPGAALALSEGRNLLRIYILLTTPAGNVGKESVSGQGHSAQRLRWGLAEAISNRVLLRHLFAEALRKSYRNLSNRANTLDTKDTSTN